MDKEVELLAKKVITVKNVISRIIGNITIFLVVVKLFRLIQISWLMVFLPWIITFLIFFCSENFRTRFCWIRLFESRRKIQRKNVYFFQKNYKRIVYKKFLKGLKILKK